MTTFKVEKNQKYGDWRLVEYTDGQWSNEWDDNWTKAEANKLLENVMKGFIDPYVVLESDDISEYIK